MSKTILLIENDASFATELSDALEAIGFQARVTGDGKHGLDLALDLRPDAIVLCVELPKLSGYSICNKIKKEEALKGIPLILTSSEATDEVFEDHKKLKVRAEEYLIKPYVPAVLLERLTRLIGMPEGGPPPEALEELETVGHGEEEVVSLEEELGLETFAAEPGEELPALDLDSLPDEPAAAASGAGILDDDLRLLDDAFDGLSATPAPRPATSRSQEPSPGPRPGMDTDAEARAADDAIEKAMGVDRPVTSEDLDAASASLPDEDESIARADLGGLADDADLALGALTDPSPESGPSAFDALDAFAGIDEPPAAPIAAGAMRDPGGNLAELARLEAELAERRASLTSRETDVRELKEKVEAAVRRAEEAESALGEQEAELASAKARGDALAGQARKADGDAKAVREESRRAVEQARQAGARAEAAEARVTAAEARVASAEAKAAAADARSRTADQEAAGQRRVAEQSAAALAAKLAELVAVQAAAARLGGVEREVERLETELVVARGEVNGARSEVEKRSTELKRRITELEAANSKNEERVVKAYLKIKGDEKVRDKARKALSIALQLLEEGLPPRPDRE